MSGMGVGLLIDEHRAEIHQGWKESVDAELGGERALEYAAGPLLRELSLALRGNAHRLGKPPQDPFGRCAVLVRSATNSVRVAREFKLLHRAVWDALRRAGRIVAIEDRRSTDEWLDEALVAALERIDRVRMRIDLLDAKPASTAPRAPAPRQRPPPLPWNRPGSKMPRPPPVVLE